MNILYLIGNGFDINLDLDTRYSDFYKHYKEVESSSEKIKQLKKEINNNYENWSDLEEAFGRYTSNINSTKEFDEIFIDIVTNLSEYLRTQESKLKTQAINQKLFYQQLSNPVLVLEPSDQQKYQENTKEYRNQQDNINIITFNYTKSIENISEYEDRHKEIFKKGPNPVLLRSIVHVHGYIDDRMILGVNDVSQVSNSTLHENDDVMNVLVKSNCNLISKQNIEQICKNLITEARVICIFGSSLGITDKMWWEQIGEQLKKGSLLIIFVKTKTDYNSTMNYYGYRLEKEFRNDFLERTNLSEEEKNKLSSNIIIRINSEMFNVLVKEEQLAN